MSLDSLKLSINNVSYIIDGDGTTFDLNTSILEYKKYFKINPDNDEEYLVPLERLNEGKENNMIIASITMITSEISRFLKMIKSKLDGKGLKEYNNYNDLIQDIVEISVTMGTSVKLIHIEVIIYNIIRDINDILIRPNFNLKYPKYQLLTITNAILKGDLILDLYFNT